MADVQRPGAAHAGGVPRRPAPPPGRPGGEATRDPRERSPPIRTAKLAVLAVLLDRRAAALAAVAALVGGALLGPDGAAAGWAIVTRP